MFKYSERRKRSICILNTDLAKTTGLESKPFRMLKYLFDLFEKTCMRTTHHLAVDNNTKHNVQIFNSFKIEMYSRELDQAQINRVLLNERMRFHVETKII